MCVQAQVPREEPQPSIDAQSETVLDKLDHETVMQERQTFRDQVSAVLGVLQVTTN